MKRNAAFFALLAALFVGSLPHAGAGTIPLIGAGKAPGTPSPTPTPAPTATAVQIAETTSNTAGSSTTYATSSPALVSNTITAGNLLTLEVYNGTGYIGYAISTPSGWTSVYNNSSSGSGIYEGLAIFSKVATSGDVSANGVVTVTQTSTTASTFSTVMVEREIAGQTSSTITGVAGTTNPSTVTFSTVTPPSVGALGFYAITTSATAAITPISWSGGPTFTSDYSFLGTEDLSMATGRTANATSTSSYNTTGTLSSAYGGQISYLYYVP